MGVSSEGVLMFNGLVSLCADGMLSSRRLPSRIQTIDSQVYF